jgi:hypothetical protein
MERSRTGITGIFRYRVVPVLLALRCIAPLPSLYGNEGAVVREWQPVVVGSTVETWRLEWQVPPEEECDPSGEDWYTCPCSGFAFGERGRLDLVRQVPGRPEERLHLSPLFAPGFDGEAVARLSRWPVRDGDMDRMDEAGFSTMVKSRPVVRIMVFADYDRDGRSTEFILQVGAGPCGHRQTVLVGISRTNPNLHVFGTVAHPDTPLVLESQEAWRQFLRSKGRTTVVSLPCGDHGSEFENDVELVATASGIRAFHVRYSCGAQRQGRLLERVEL